MTNSDRATYNISASSLQSAIEKVISEGQLKPAAVVAVDLFGQPFDYDSIRQVCERYNLLLLEDAAQGFGGHISLSTDKDEKGATGKDKKGAAGKDEKGATGKDGWRIAGSLGKISTTSFFPAKPLGCYGDGGAIFTDDDEIATLARSIAVHGKDMGNPDDPNSKYNNIRLGYNSRLDTLQAAVLLAKFPQFTSYELEAVNHVAELYSTLLSDVPGLTIPTVLDGYFSSWAQYTIQLPPIFSSGESMGELKGKPMDRGLVQKKLREAGIPTNIYYIKPMHKQGAFEGTRSAEADCPVTEELCKTVLCLPIHPYLEDSEVKYISDKLKAVL